MNGQGDSRNKGPENIVIITDSGGGWYNSNLINHADGSAILFLSGRAVLRIGDQLQYVWNGGAHVWR
ncbi:MAG: hypothetical protein ACI8W8_005090 [Rhodothermales bacterium]|jgi:hypothetical protein